MPTGTQVLRQSYRGATLATPQHLIKPVDKTKLYLLDFRYFLLKPSFCVKHAQDQQLGFVSKLRLNLCSFAYAIEKANGCHSVRRLQNSQKSEASPFHLHTSIFCWNQRWGVILPAQQVLRSRWHLLMNLNHSSCYSLAVPAISMNLQIHSLANKLPQKLEVIIFFEGNAFERHGIFLTYWEIEACYSWLARQGYMQGSERWWPLPENVE